MPSERATGALSVRPYRGSDLASVYEICVRTGDRGGDATGKFEHPELLADTFAGPYVFLEPELAFVLDCDGTAVGYVLGTAGTARFVESYRERWMPRLASRYPRRPTTAVTPDDWLLALYHNPERMLVPGTEAYPGHLHIDILPAHQGSGYGRELISTFFSALAMRGCPGAYVAVAVDNVRAHGFYLRVGFELLPIAGQGVIYYGRKAVTAA